MIKRENWMIKREKPFSAILPEGSNGWMQIVDATGYETATVFGLDASEICAIICKALNSFDIESFVGAGHEDTKRES